jgi:hypothetical protein
LVPLSGLTGFLVVSRLALTDSAMRVLTVLLGGFDNGPHFGMFLMLRHHGATLDALGNAQDGSPWLYASYPQGFHAVVATFADVLGGEPGSGATDLVTYAHGVAALVIFAVMVLTAALVALPGLRERPVIALVSVAVLCSAFLWQPGLNTLADGFANFWLGAVAISIALLVGVWSRGTSSGVSAAAVGGLIMLTAHSWIPLVVFAIPATLAVLSRGDEARQPLRERLLRLLPLCLAALGTLRAVSAILGGGVNAHTVVEAAGPIHAAPPGFPLGVLVVSLYLFGGYRPLARAFGRPALESASWRKVRLLGLTPVLASLVVGLLLVAQLRTIGTTSYYLVKLIMGCDLVLTAMVAAVGGMLAAQVVPAPARPRSARTPIVVAGVLAGLLLGGTAVGAIPRISPPVAGKDAAGARLHVPDIAADILAASRGQSSDVALRTEYVALGAGHARFVEITDVWFHALTCSASTAAAQRTAAVGGQEVTDEESASRAVRTVLSHDARALVLVNREREAPLVRDMSSTNRVRVRGFQSRPSENADSRSCWE